MYNAIHRCGGYKNIFLKGCGSGGGAMNVYGTQHTIKKT